MTSHFTPWPESALPEMVEQFKAQMRDLVENVLRDILVDAQKDFERIILTSTTPTGIARQDAGRGIAGRVETGRMLGAGGAVEDFGSADKKVIEWGWLDDYAAYFAAQEEGTAQIGAMHALLGSFVQAREDLRQKLIDAGFKVNG